MTLLWFKQKKTQDSGELSICSGPLILWLGIVPIVTYNALSIDISQCFNSCITGAPLPSL